MNTPEGDYQHALQFNEELRVVHRALNDVEVRFRNGHVPVDLQAIWTEAWNAGFHAGLSEGRKEILDEL